MAWITPVTDRTAGAYHTLDDQNRIAGNLDFLATELAARELYTGPTITKTTYTKNDYISKADWTDILSVLSALYSAFAIQPETPPNYEMTFENMNIVESLTLAVYEKYQTLLLQENLNHYSGDNIYTEGANSIYAGGVAT